MGTKVDIFSDGACSGNPGPGGWGSVINTNGKQVELSGRDPDTTNNRMELTAVIEALKSLSDHPDCTHCMVTVTTDSQYVKNGITSWIHGWKRKGWKNSAGDPVKNQDLWESLDALNRQFEPEWKWVKGHAGHPENERCDELARAAIAGRVAKSVAPKAKPKAEHVVTISLTVDDVMKSAPACLDPATGKVGRWSREQCSEFLKHVEAELVGRLTREAYGIIREKSEDYMHSQSEFPDTAVARGR